MICNRVAGVVVFYVAIKDSDSEKTKIIYRKTTYYKNTRTYFSFENKTFTLYPLSRNNFYNFSRFLLLITYFNIFLEICN